MKKKTIHRYPPCSMLDVERLESWLTDMAAEGWHLQDTGIFLRTFVFEKGEPRNVRYRLEPGTGEPDYPAKMLFKELGWEPVMGYSQFYIFRALSPDVPELNTDPAVQLMTMKRLQRKTLFWNLIAFALVPFLLATRFGEGYRFLITFGALVSVLLLGIMAFFVVELVVQIVQSGAVVRKLKAGIPLDHNKPWRKYAWYHRIGTVAVLIFYAVYMMSMLTQCSASVAQMDRSIAEYQGDPPFVTMTDLCPEGEYTPKDIMDSYNTFAEYSSDCAPVNVEWKEYAEIVTPDGEIYSGTLIIHYHETAAEWMAQGLAEEYLRVALQSKYHKTLEIPELDVDYAAAYSNQGCPTIIFQDGTTVITASIGVKHDGEYMLQEWVDLMLEKLNTP